jgi:hypothetical protein
VKEKTRETKFSLLNLKKGRGCEFFSHFEREHTPLKTKLVS